MYSQVRLQFTKFAYGSLAGFFVSESENPSHDCLAMLLCRRVVQSLWPLSANHMEEAYAEIGRQLWHELALGLDQSYVLEPCLFSSMIKNRHDYKYDLTSG